MDRREVFDKVKTHLLAQNKPARSYAQNGAPTGCVYKTENGLKCAIGCLIPSEHYTPEIENKGVGSVRVRALLKEIGLPVDTDTMDMYMELQELHDEVEPTHWKESLDDIEERYFFRVQR